MYGTERSGFSQDSNFNPFDIVVVAASAGGVEALLRVLGALPVEFPAPIVLVQHLPSSLKYVSRLTHVLNLRSRLFVKMG